MGLVVLVALVLEGVNGQAVVCFANLLDVVFQAAIREKWCHLCCRSCRSRQSASAHSNIRQELSHLEWVSLLLHELVDKSVLTSLFRLLHLGTYTQLLASHTQHAVHVVHAGVNCLRVTLIVDVSHGRTHGEILLVCKVCSSNASAVAAKCARLNCGAKSARLRLFIGLLYLRAGRVGNVFDVGIQVLVHVFVNRTHASDIVDALNALQLLLIELSNKFFRLGAVFLERVLRDLLGLSIHSVVSVKHILRDGDFVR